MIKEYEKRFWALLQELGINAAQGSQWEIQGNISRLKELEDWPVEWFDALRDTCRMNGVMNVGTVLKYMEYAKANDLMPGDKPVMQKKLAGYTDEQIQEYITEWLERRADQDDLPEHSKVAMEIYASSIS